MNIHLSALLIPDPVQAIWRYLAVRLCGIWLKDSKSCCCQENKSLFIQSLVPRAINWNTEHQAILVMNDSSIQILNVQLSYGHYSTAAFLAEYVFVCLFFFLMQITKLKMRHWLGAIPFLSTLLPSYKQIFCRGYKSHFQEAALLAYVFSPEYFWGGLEENGSFSVKKSWFISEGGIMTTFFLCRLILTKMVNLQFKRRKKHQQLL